MDLMGVLVDQDILPVDDLEDDFVDVNRVSVGGGVVELPQLGCTNHWVLGDRHPPFELAPGADACIRIPAHDAELRLDRRVSEEPR